MKKKLFIVYVLISFIYQANAQSKYSLGLMASPDLTYINASFSKGTHGATYSTQPGYTFGLSIYKKSTKHFFITSGMWYINKGTVQYSNFIFSDSNNVSELMVSGKTIHSYKDLDIPILFNYTLGKRKLKFVCSAGFVFGFSFLLKLISTAAQYYDVTYIHNTPKRPARINLNFSFGATYKLNETFTLIFEPNYKIDVRAIVNPIMDDSHSYGLRTTLIYKFKQ